MVGPGRAAGGQYEYSQRTLEAGAGALLASVRRLTVEETALPRQINEDLPADTWELYEALLARGAAAQLSPEEQRALLSLSDQIEALVELA